MYERKDVPSLDRPGDSGPLAGWVLAQCHGMTLIGRAAFFEADAGPQRDRMRLSPVFELKPMLGERGIAHVVVPVWLLGVREVDLPAGCVVKPCEELSRGERVRLHKGVAMATEMLEGMRAQDAGLVVATKMPGGGR